MRLSCFLNCVPASVADALRDELHKVTRQEWLLKNVIWWYLLPLFVGLEMFTFGLDRPLDDKLTMTGAFLLTYAVIYWANRHAAHRHAPVRRQVHREHDERGPAAAYLAFDRVSSGEGALRLGEGREAWVR